MPSEYLHGILPQLPFTNANVTLLHGEGRFSTGGTLNLFLQGRNRAGYTQPSEVVIVTYAATQAIQISFPATARTEATDFHYYIVSHSPTGDPADAIALFQWTNYEENQVTTRPLFPVVLSLDRHVELAPSVATPSDLPSSDLLDGMCRLVIGGVPTSAYYQLQKYEPKPADGSKILLQYGAKWVRIGSPNLGTIDDVFATDGCASPIRATAVESLILPPSYAADGTTPIKGTPLKIIWRNDAATSLPRGTSFVISVRMDGALASQLFDGKLRVTPRGFVDLDDGTLDTSDGLGGTMPDIDGELTWTYGDRTILFLHKDLPAGAAYYVEVAPYFTVGQLQGRVLEGSQISIDISPAAQAGESAYSIWKITGDAVFADEGRLRVVPDVGLNARMLSGSALIQRFVFPPVGERPIYGIQPNLANQKITLDGNGSLFYRGTGEVPGTEGIRALVSCEIGDSVASNWSATVTGSGGLTVTLSYPCNADGYGTVRSDYPTLAGNSKGRFNPPYLRLFVRRQSNSTIYQIDALVTVLADDTQVVTISTLSNATEIISLPVRSSPNFCLFDPPTVTVALTSGDLASDTYSVAAAYYFDGSAISAISHSPENGCIYEASGSIEDLFAVRRSWGESVADIDALKALELEERYSYQCRPVINTPSGTQQYTFFPEASEGVKPTDLSDTTLGRWLPVNKGFTPTLSIGTVTSADDPNGAAATLGGTLESPVLNLVIPRGQRGKPGIGIPGEKGEPGIGGDPKLEGNAVYYVATAGSDDNSGLSFDTPFATIQKFIDTIAVYDLNGHRVECIVGSGVYNQGVFLKPLKGVGRAFISGSGSDEPSIISTTNLDCIYGEYISPGASYSISGFTLETNGDYGCGVSLYQAKEVTLGNLALLETKNEHFYIGSYSEVGIYYISIKGSAPSHIYSDYGSTVRMVGEYIFSNNPNFSEAFVGSDEKSLIVINADFIGTATGMKYKLMGDSKIILPDNFAEDLLPGDLAGTVKKSNILG